MEEYTVYKHVNKINGKVYVGLTNNVKRRWRNSGYFYKGSPYFKHAIDKYGWDNFEHEILFEHLTEEEAKQKETEMVLYYRSNEPEYGYNLTNGGDLNVPNEEIRKQISNTQRKRMQNPEVRQKIKLGSQKREQKYKQQGIKNPFYGKTHTKESRQKMSKSNWYNKDPEKFMEIHKNHLNCGGAESRFAKKVVRLIDGKVYNTVTECAKDNNTSTGTITNHCKNYVIKQYMYLNEWDALSEQKKELKREISLDKKQNPNKYTLVGKTVIHIPSGEVFYCISDCMKKFHMDSRTIHKHCNGKVESPLFKYLEENINEK